MSEKNRGRILTADLGLTYGRFFADLRRIYGGITVDLRQDAVRFLVALECGVAVE